MVHGSHGVGYQIVTHSGQYLLTVESSTEFEASFRRMYTGPFVLRYFTINVPLQDNITDESYLAVYEPVIRTAFERFKPQVGCSGRS